MIDDPLNEHGLRPLLMMVKLIDYIKQQSKALAREIQPYYRCGTIIAWYFQEFISMPRKTHISDSNIHNRIDASGV